MSVNKQVYSILETVKNIHIKLMKRLDEFEKREGDEQLSYLLDYMKDYEKESMETLGQLDQKTRENILDTWVRYYPGKTEAEIDAIITNSEIRNSNDVIELLFTCKGKVVSLFEDCANAVMAPEVKKYFEDLKSFEQAQLNNLGRRATELEQGY